MTGLIIVVIVGVVLWLLGFGWCLHAGNGWLVVVCLAFPGFGVVAGLAFLVVGLPMLLGSPPPAAPTATTDHPSAWERQ